MPVTSSSGPGSWMSRSSQKNVPAAAACSMSCQLASVARPPCLSVPFMGTMLSRSGGGSLIRAGWPVRGRRSVLGGVHGGDISRGSAEPAFNVGQPVADHRQPLAQVGMARPELLLVGVGVLLDEYRGHGGGEHADQADPDQHEDHGDGPAAAGGGVLVPVANGGHGDNGPPESFGVVMDVAPVR